MRAKLLSIFFTSCVILASTLAGGYVLEGNKWYTNTVAYDEHRLPESFKEAVWYGASRWNSVSGSRLDWKRSDSGENDVYTAYIDGAGDVFARESTTTNPYNKAEITRTTIKFDEDERWYTGSGTPRSTQVDLRSEAVHEFGHGLGLDHTQSSVCRASESSRPTMCSGYKKGETWKRSLETDDKDGAKALYGTSAHQIIATGSPCVDSDFDYEDLTDEKRINRSDYILAGTVTSISDTQYNQDGGEYWEERGEDGEMINDALPYYTVEISSTTSLFGKATDDESVTLAVLGESPRHHSCATPDGPFEIGQEVLVFVRHKQLAWREGKRKDFLMPVGNPDGTLVKGTDGLFYHLPSQKVTGMSLEDVMNDIALSKR